MVISKGRIPNSYYVHFGSTEVGVETLLMSDLTLLRSGNIPYVAAINMGSLPNSSNGLGLSTSHWDLLASISDASSSDSLVASWRQELISEQAKDPVFGKIIQYLVDGTLSNLWSAGQKKRATNFLTLYSVDEGVLYRSDSSFEPRVVVPVSLIPTVLFLCHDAVQHFDWHRSYELLAPLYYIHGAPELVRRYVGSCVTCQKSRNYKYHKLNFGVELAERMSYFTAGVSWAIDLKKLPDDNHGCSQMLIAIDLCSRYVIAIPLPDKTKEIVTEAIFTHILSKFGGDSNTEFMSDQGSEFINDYAAHLLRTYRVRCIAIQARHSQANGMVERFMQTFMIHFSKAMSLRVLNPKEWSLWLTQLVTCYNATYNAQLGNTPYFRMFHKEFVLTPTMDLLMQNQPVIGDVPSAEEYAARLTQNHHHIKRLLDSQFRTTKRYLEFERALANEVPNFNKGDLVLVSLGDSNGGYLLKNRAHAGPFRILHRSSTSNYMLTGADGIAVEIHGFKILPYNATLADNLGITGLAGSAQGAALARLLSYEQDVSVEVTSRTLA